MPFIQPKNSFFITKCHFSAIIFCGYKRIAYFCTRKPHNAGKAATHRVCIVCFDPLAQLVEQYTFNVWVLGSSPKRITYGE